MPTQESIRLNNMKRLMPEYCASCQQDKPDAVAICELRPFDLTVKDDQLLAKKSIFHQKVGSTAAQISNRANSQRDSGWLNPTFYLLLNPMGKRRPERVWGIIHFVSGLRRMAIKTYDNSGAAKTCIFG
jgi:hypothetical protein